MAPQPDRAVARMPLTVRYHECDPQGVVFNAHYLAYADMASFEAVGALFGSYATLRERGHDLVLAESSVRYLAPCRFGDELVVDAFVGRVGTTSMVLRFALARDGEPVTEVTNRYVWVDADTLQPAAPPEDVRETITAWASDPGTSV